MTDKSGRSLANTIRLETPKDTAAIEQLMAVAFGEARHNRSVRHLRLCHPVADLCFVMKLDDEVVGSIRYWPIMVAGKKQLLLGPLAIDPRHKGRGFGKALVSHSLEVASRLNYDFTLISGEPDYYPRFGFVSASLDAFLWPGFIEAERLQIKWFGKDKPRLLTKQAILPITNEQV